MARKVTEDSPSPPESFSSTATPSSSKTKTTAVSVTDVKYRGSLSYRSIYIGCRDPPIELMRRATEIISHPRALLELDDATVQELRDTLRRMENEAETTISNHITDAVGKIPDQRLASVVGRLWSDSVPVPLRQDFFTAQVPLPRPKPDLAFGYSIAAFNDRQLNAINLLVDGQSMRSYAMPDKQLRFPFLTIEFKSQATGGSHYIATNQVAGAGAIALNGYMELIERGAGTAPFDFHEPLFFSLAIDHAYAQIYVHWVQRDAAAAAAGGQRPPYSFHVERLAEHLLRGADGARAVVRAVRNILDYAYGPRLPRLCAALDAYVEVLLAARQE